jgi:hypothetical protein
MPPNPPPPRNAICWRQKSEDRSEQGRREATEEFAFHDSGPPPKKTYWRAPPRARITTARNTDQDPDKQSDQSTQMTNATVSDKKVSFWVSNFMTR